MQVMCCFGADKFGQEVGMGFTISLWYKVLERSSLTAPSAKQLCHLHWEWLKEGFQRRDLVKRRRKEESGGRRKEERKEGRQPSYLQIVLRLQAQTLGLWKQYVLDAVCCPIQYLSSTSVFWVGFYYTLERFFSTFITVGFAIGSWHLVNENLYYCLLPMLSFLLQILTQYVELQLLRGHLLNMKKRQCHGQSSLSFCLPPDFRSYGKKANPDLESQFLLHASKCIPNW